ncbi:hypothetical protein Pcinc_008907 [Petrolisthes cinctipes]|nr:hypothetical protein Pcinc_008907 [Petrolisthes cinctipes]
MQRLLRCWEVAAHNSEQARDKEKNWYEKRARHREFHPDVVPNDYAISTPSSSITHENPLIRLLTPQFLCALLTFALLIASTLPSVKVWQSNSATMQEKLENLQPQKTEVLDLL